MPTATQRFASLLPEALLSAEPSPEEAAAEREERVILFEALWRLPPREQAILRLRVVRDLTLAQVADVFGLSRERVRQIEVSALTALRSRLGKALHATI